ncbi:hypothetical protein CKAH01_08106 [Colletotrichum kahawae]|uniref:Uncharacterized protein n=1 Tax=Colletotrichum kahawae TaxID=34407 RepID=A0AAE0D0M0_COLKA|nr:hypothetical protein CKAH01_08106 [Colletotrichum kahawae]
MMAPGITFKNPFTGSTHKTGRVAPEEGEGEAAADALSSPSRRRLALTGDKSTGASSGRLSPRSGRGDKSAEKEPQKEYEKGESSRMAVERVEKERAKAGSSSASASAPAPLMPPAPLIPPVPTQQKQQQQQGSPKGSPKGRRRGTLAESDAGDDGGGEVLSGVTTLAGSFADGSSFLEVKGRGKEECVEGQQQQQQRDQDGTRTEGIEEEEGEEDHRLASSSPPPPSCHKRHVIKGAFVAVGKALTFKKNKGKGRAGECALDCYLRQSRSWEVVRNKVKFPEAWWRAGWLKK